MADFYSVGGNINQDAWILVINESDWSMESQNLTPPGDYYIYTTSGTKLVVTTDIYGESYGYGAVEPTFPPLPTRTGDVWISSTHTPLSVTLNVTERGVTDGDREAVAGTNWTYHASWGVDFGRIGTIQGMDVYCWCTYGDPTGYYSAGHDSVEVYKSDDNVTWTLVQHFDAPEIISHSTQRFAFKLTFDEPHTARYFTVWNAESSSYLAVSAGAVLRVNEIEVFQQLEGE